MLQDTEVLQCQFWSGALAFFTVAVLGGMIGVAPGQIGAVDVTVACRVFVTVKHIIE